MDPRTDAAIQETIRTSLHDTTILCIAHRLATVAYYDRVRLGGESEQRMAMRTTTTATKSVD